MYVAGEAMRSITSRALVRAVALARSMTSWLRKLLLRLQFPGLRFVGEVHVGPQCEITVVPGGQLTIDNCHIARGVHITVDRDASIVLSADYVGRNTTIVARTLVHIGDGSKIAENVVIRDGNHDHSVPLCEQRYVESPIEIGSDVWLGAGMIVLAGASVGDGTTVGAGAVVTSAIPSKCVAVGVPAKVVGSTIRNGGAPR